MGLPKHVGLGKHEARKGLWTEAVAGCGDTMRRRMGTIEGYLVVPLTAEELESISSVCVHARHDEGLTTRSVEVRKV